MKTASQLSFLEEDHLQEPAEVTSYFTELLQFLHMRDDTAGWTDNFGDALHTGIRDIFDTPIRILSLFSGGGGLDIAFHDCGFHALQMIEINSRYIETLQANAQIGQRFEESEPLCIDIQDFQPANNLKVDFIIGGPPCQTFSAAGRRAAGVSGFDDPRGLLFREYVRILKLLQPKGFLFENVSGIVGAQGGKAWQEILATFEALGYTISYRILDAADYGVPQHRERLIIVGTHSKPLAFPRPTHGPDSTDRRPYYTAGLAVENVSDEKPGSVNGRYGYLLKDIPPGLNYSFYTEEMGHPQPQFAWRSKFSDLLYKADPTTPVRTIKAQGGQYTGPFHWDNRAFSIGELKRLQTFPDNYSIAGGRLAAIEQIGNSVPPQFGRILALAVLDQIFGIPLPFKMDYLSPQEELSFKQRKSHLTKLYREKAKIAIAELYPDRKTTDERIDLTDRTGQQNTDNQIVYKAYLGKDFSWYVEGECDQDYPWNIEYAVTEEDDNVEFSVKYIGSNYLSSNAPIIVEILPRRAWKIPTRKIYLRSYESSLYSLTACWKAFEHYIATRKIKADLVQLNNYYQYDPLIEIKVLKLEPQVRNNEAAVYQWDIMKHILEGKVVRQITHIGDMAASWKLSIGQTIDFLMQLRSMGYEVRSEYTNSQIPVGHILIPYAFPTFTPKSVQLRKKLFPDVFFEQEGFAMKENYAASNDKLWSNEELNELEPESQPEDTNISELRNKGHLEVYTRASILVNDNNIVKSIWFEGKQSKAAQERYQKITTALSKGYLDSKLDAAKSATIGSVFESQLSDGQKQALEEIVASVTAQRGRALVEIIILQLAVKAICPEQDVRLHKGSRGNEDTTNGKTTRRKKRKADALIEEDMEIEQRSRFSWQEGISMRRLDDTFVVPMLRRHGLLRMNEYGAFMTRTFAENYPYTLYYKAEISGAKRRWLEIIDQLESGQLDAESALLYVLDLLWKASEQFKQLTKETIGKLEQWVDRNSHPSIDDISAVIEKHINQSDARARLLEIAMHSLLQALEDSGIDIGGKLKPLMPMRTANQKHRNFGDVEVIYGDFVTESWDAKYDNPYLSDALDVFIEKIRGKDVSELKFGYVLFPERKEYRDVDRKIANIADEFSILVQTYSFREWVQQQLLRASYENTAEGTLARAWIRAYTESLALMREDRAPIDEPTYDWLQSLQSVLG